jgi:Carboxypeptidase regulatory-like domain
MRRILLSALSQWVICGFALTFTCSVASAQFTSAIEGTVMDPTGAVVTKAKVTIKNLSTGAERTVETSEAGYFRISSLPASTFNVTASASGFKTSVQNVSLEVAQITTLNIGLQLGGTAEEVLVTGEAPQIESSQASVSNLIDQKRVANMPLVGRNFYTLVVLTPGVTGLPSGGGQAYAQATGDIFSAEYGVNLNGNGQRAESNGFLVDSANVGATPRGGVTNVNPNADTVQELRVSVNNYSAENGRNSSVLVNVLTKSGTNDFHGTIGWYHTNNRLQARTFTQSRVPVFRRNEANWTFGGPIIKNKTHFFASMDILRSGVGTGFIANTVTQDFIDIMKQRFPNNISTFVMSTFRDQLVSTSVNRTVGQELATINPDAPRCTGSEPVSTRIGVLPCNFPLTKSGSFEQTLPRDGVQWNARIDHQFNNGNDRIYGNVYRTTNQLVTFGTPNVYPDFTTIQPQYTNYGNINHTHIFSPNLLNEMAVGATRAYGEAPLAHGEIPLIEVPGISAYGTGFSDATFIQNNFEWRDMMSYNRGSHSFKFGARYAKDDAWKGGAKFANVFTRPRFNFNNLFDFALDDPFQETNIGFNPQTGENKGVDFRPYFPSLAFFVNDDWKVRPNLTLTLGLRWETFFAPGDYDDFFTGMVFQGGNTFQERIANSKSVNKPPLDGTDYNNFAPRIGIAWAPKAGEGNLSIRAGVGVFYDRFAGQFFHDAQTFAPVFGIATARKDTPPVVPVYGLSRTTESPWQFPVIPNLRVGLDPKGGLLGVPSELSNADPNMRTQYSINWSLAIQYAFAGNYVVEGAYIGSVGRKLYQEYDVNRFNGDLLDGRLDRLNTSFGVIGYAQANGSSSYHGATASIKRRFSQGLDFQVGYTIGKAIDTASSFGRGLNIFDPLNMRLNRGRADFDVRQKLAASIVYDLPKPNYSGFLGKVFEGWQVGAITILQSGPPLSVNCSLAFTAVRDASGRVIGNTGCDFNADGRVDDPLNVPSFGNSLSGLERSNYMAPNRIFQVSDFPRPGLGQVGYLGRNTYESPGYANTDFILAKRTRVPWFWGKEGANLLFRTEFFNLFNRVNLDRAIGNISNPDFGRSTRAFGARNLQFALKLEF